jgi:hypothetical protein
VKDAAGGGSADVFVLEDLDSGDAKAEGSGGSIELGMDQRFNTEGTEKGVRARSVLGGAWRLDRLVAAASEGTPH